MDKKLAGHLNVKTNEKKQNLNIEALMRLHALHEMISRKKSCDIYAFSRARFLGPDDQVMDSLFVLFSSFLFFFVRLGSRQSLPELVILKFNIRCHSLYVELVCPVLIASATKIKSLQLVPP